MIRNKNPILSIVLTASLLLVSWFNLNFLSSIYWMCCLIFIYLIFSEDIEAREVNKQSGNIKLVLITICGFSLFIILMHVGISIHYSFSKDTKSFNETIKVLGFNNITADEFTVKNLFSLIFSIVTLALGIVFYRYYINVPNEQEVDVEKNEFDEMEKEQVFGPEMNKRKTIRSLKRLNLISQLSLLAIVILNDGAIAILYALFMIIIFIKYMVTSSETSSLTLWKILLPIMKILTFALLYIHLFFRIDIIVDNIPEKVILLFGNIYKSSLLSFYGLVPLLLFFAVMCLQTSTMSYLYKLQENLDDKDFVFLFREENAGGTFQKFWKIIEKYLRETAIRRYQLLLIAWCMLHPSGLFFLLLLCGVFGLLIDRQYFRGWFFDFVHGLGSLYLLTQTIFNVTFIFDSISNSDELFLIGIFKYALVDQNQILYEIRQVDPYDLVIRRSLGLGLDAAIFILLNSIYVDNKRVRTVNRQALSIIPDLRALAEEEGKENEEGRRESVDSAMARGRVGDGKNIKEKIIKYIKSFMEAIVIHTNKIALIILFLAAIYTIDLLHTGYFLLFLIFCLLGRKKTQKFWIVLLVYTGLVILSLYGFQIVASYLDISTNYTLIHVGLIKTKRLMLLYYKEHLILLFILFMQSALYDTNKYKEYIALVDSEDNQENSKFGEERLPHEVEEEKMVSEETRMIPESKKDENLNNKKKKARTDLFTYFYIKYGLWLCYVCLLIVGFLPPPNISSLIYLLFLTTFIILTLLYNDERKSFLKLRTIWPFMIVFSFIILIMRYLYQLDFISSYFEDINKTNIALKDFGLDKDLNNLKLIGNAAILALVNAQKKIFMDPNYETWQKSIKIKNKKQQKKLKHGTLAYSIYCIQVYLKQFFFSHISKFLLFLILFSSLSQKSCIGILYFSFSIIILIMEKETRWTAAWIPMCFYSITIIIVQYLLQLKFFENFMKDIIHWGGFSYDTEDIVGLILQNIIILLVCIIHRKSQRWANLVVDQEDIELFKREYQEISSDFENLKKKFHSDSLQKLPEDQQFIANKFQSYVLKLPIVDGMSVYEKIDEIYIKLGYELSLFLIVVAAFFQLNIVSIFYIVIAAYFSFYAKYLFNEDEESREKVRSLLTKWKIVYFFIAVNLIRQYAILLWFPISWNIFYPWKDSEFWCDMASKNSFSRSAEFHDESDLVKCLNNWKKWMSFERTRDHEIFIEFLAFFFMILYEKYIISNREEVVRVMKTGDRGDFTYSVNRTSIWKQLKFLIYCYFYKFVLMFLFIVGAIDNLEGSSDLISGIYLVGSIYLLYKSSYLFQHKNKIWKRVETFNNVIMILYVIYQAPFFPCPIVHDRDRFYFSPDECLYEQDHNKGFFIISSATDKLQQEDNHFEVFYIIISHTLGINKLSQGYMSKALFMVLFFFLGLLQRKIWNHPYIIHYINPYIQREKENYSMRAVKYVESVHLRRNWASECSLVQREIFTSLLGRVDSKVKQWENLLTSNKDHDEVASLKVDQGNVEMEELNAKAEKYIIKKDGAVIHLNAVQEAFIKSKGDRQKAEVLITLEQRRAEKEALMKIYHKGAIGIYPYLEDLKKRLEIEDRKIEEQANKLTLAEEEEKKEEQEERSIFSMIKDPVPLQEEEKKEEEIPANKEELIKQDSLIKQESAEKPKAPTTSWYKRMSENLNNYYNNSIEKLKVFLVKYIHEIYHYENGEYQFKGKEGLLVIIIYLLMSHMNKICFFFFIINHIVNTNLISMVYPLSLFFYALLENPIPQKGYWRFMILYTIMIILVQFIYQLPVFCDSPPYSIFYYTSDSQCRSASSSTFTLSPSDLINRIDFVIGIRKFSGSASYPKNQGFFIGVIWDYLVLLFLLLQRFLLETLGFWNYVKIDQSSYYIPQFKSIDKSEKFSKETEESTEKINIEDENDGNKQVSEDKTRADLIDRRNKTIRQKREPFLKRTKSSMLSFFYRLFPEYLPDTHELQDMATKEKKIVKTEPVLIKPGKDYHAETFTSSLMILAYFVFFYSKMNGKRESLSETLDNNSQFSGDLVIAILMIIIWIITDRIIYKMRRNLKDKRERSKLQAKSEFDISLHSMLIKVALHMFLVIFIHIYLCFNLPSNSKVFFIEAPYLVICYFLFCIYFYFSSLQIKEGYSDFNGGQIFTESTELFNRLAFKTYRAIPFLTELKSILDWTVTKTSLDLFQWIKLDDAYSNLYICKADMDARKEHEYGTPRDFIEKCSFGCLLVIMLLLVIVGPILMFSTLNPILEINNANRGVISINLVSRSYENGNTVISSSFKIFEVNNLIIAPVTKDEFMSLRNTYNGIEKDWEPRMQKVTVLPYSESTWDISPPRLKSLKSLLSKNDEVFMITAEWSFTRLHPPGHEVAKGSNTLILNENMKKSLVTLIDTKNLNAPTLEIPNLFPLFIALGQSSSARAKELATFASNTQSNLACVLEAGEEGGQKYWSLRKKSSSSYKSDIFRSTENKLTFVLINDFVIGSLFGATVSNVSVIGLYATFVLAIGRFVRIFFDKISQRVIYEEMPNTDDLFDLCEGIYIARMEGDLAKEQSLYELLIRIYRSPEILLKLTGTNIIEKKK